jgi:hypothetical protein
MSRLAPPACLIQELASVHVIHGETLTKSPPSFTFFICGILKSVRRRAAVLFTHEFLTEDDTQQAHRFLLDCHTRSGYKPRDSAPSNRIDQRLVA